MDDSFSIEIAAYAGLFLASLVPALLFARRPTSVARRFLGATAWCLPVAVLILMVSDLRHQVVGDARVGQTYRQTWRAIDQAADAAVEVLEASDLGSGYRRLELFELLADPAIDLSPEGGARSSRHGLTILVFDALGEAVAWRGPGLLHEPDVDALSANGSSWTRGHTATTLWTTRFFGPSNRWRLVSGTSLALEPFPFGPARERDPPGGSPGWVLASADGRLPTGPDAPTIRVVSPDPGSGHPALWLQVLPSPPLDVRAWLRSPARRAVVVILGWLTAIWAGLHLLWPVAGGEPGVSRRWILCLALFTGLAGSWLGAGASSLTAGCAALLWTVLMARQGRGPVDEAAPSVDRPGTSPWPVFGVGAAGFALLLGACWWLQHALGPLDLSGIEAAGADGWAIRFALGAFAVALFQSLPSLPARALSAGFWRPFPWGSLFLLSAAAVQSRHPLPWMLGAAAAGCFSLWWSTAGRRAVLPQATLALVASLLAALAWQSTGRVLLQQRIEQVYLPLSVPPTEEEREELRAELQSYFGSWAPADQAFTQAPGGVWSHDDLAFKLWQQSPLPARDGLSAVHVITVDGDESSFSFGLPLGDGGEPSLKASRLRVPASPSWSSVIRGETLVYSGDEFWGQIQYFLIPRPGFRLEINEIEELERHLVREKPRDDMADGLPEEVGYGFFNLQGKAIASPWETLPPLPPEVLAKPDGRTRWSTPSGESWCWLQLEERGVTALFLPVLTPREGLERLGFVAFGICGPLLCGICLLWLIPSSWGRLWSTLQAALRSYSKRLILVYTLLLLMPLVALNLILLRSFSDRLQQENLADAQRAMVSARELLVSYLQDLEPGVLIETQVNRDLLEWMSDLVQHQVNLYWGSRIYRSSQEELFTSGLSPRRIPDEIFTRLTLVGHGMELRRQQTGELTYLEVYAPLDVPGVVSSQQELFLSVPLLEQEEEAEQRLSALRRRALLVTSALFILLTAVGSRLTRSFTRPIVELIAGTERIARGEPFPDIRPRETELSALAQAIDTMSRQVDDSHRGLVREKRFVERVVANITSAVVSLDHEHRVAFQNDVAAQLLGTAVGEPIDRRLAEEPELAPLRDFWRQAQAEGQKQERQVKLRPAGETVDVREWSLTWVPIPGDADPAALLVVDDDTEVMRGQRLEAWAEMARIIAHEIKNPLTPIQLSAEHLRQVRKVEPDRFDEIFDRCTDNILTNVEELRSIASEFSIYSRIPAAKLVTADLAEAMAELAEAYRDAAGGGVEMVLHAPPEPVPARFDEKLLGRAVRNLLENAYRAAAAEGGRVELTARRGDSGRFAEVEVRDSGPGVDPQKLKRIFEPYFSTYETGTGLGLAIVQRIVNEHGGEVEARNRPSGGLSVIIRIPLAEAGHKDSDSS